MDEAKRGGRFRGLAWAACIIAAGIGAEARAGVYSGLIVFGDSLSDGGNVAAEVTAAGGAFPYSVYPAGTFTNGATWVDYLAQMLGVPTPQASLLGGTNYAYAYAQTGTGVTNPSELGGLPIPNLLSQVGSFSGSIGSNELVAIWAGSNDILHGAVVDLAGVAASVGNVMAALQAVYDLGGRHFLVGGVPYLGTIPAVSGYPDAVKDGLNQLSFAFNTLLAGSLANFRATHAGTQVAYNDVNTTFAAILAAPSAYGLTNVTDPAVLAIPAGGDPNPDHYLFWDDVHPTTVVHKLIAETAFAAAVPEPSSIVLAAIAGVGVAVAARRRSA